MSDVSTGESENELRWLYEREQEERRFLFGLIAILIVSFHALALGLLIIG